MLPEISAGLGLQPHHAGGIVLAAIVHYDQLDLGRQLLQRGQRLRHDYDQASGFVKGRHDARDRIGCARAGNHAIDGKAALRRELYRQQCDNFQ